jgi:hypothetical protein
MWAVIHRPPFPLECLCSCWRSLARLRQNLEKANEKVYGKGEVLRFYDRQPAAGTDEEMTASK